MSNTWYINPVSGNNSDNGQSWATAFLTWAGATVAKGVAGGDLIKIAKTADPVSIGSATFTNASSTITPATANLTKTISTCESAWTTVGAGMSSTVSTVKVQGTYSIYVGFITTTETYGYKALGSTIDYSAYTGITLWIYTQTAISANQFRIDLCSGADGTGVVDSFTLPAMAYTSTWYPIYISRDGGGYCGTSIQSIRIYAVGTPANHNIYMDNIEACTSTLNFQSVFGKNTINEPWMTVRNLINGVITIGNASFASKYYGTEGSATLYTREVIIKTASESQANITGTILNPTTFSGGWNTTTGIQDGYTFYMCLPTSQDVINTSTYNNAYQNIGVCSGHSGIQFGNSSSTGHVLTNIYAVCNNYSGIYLGTVGLSGCMCFLTNIIAFGANQYGIHLGSSYTTLPHLQFYNVIVMACNNYGFFQTVDNWVVQGANLILTGNNSYGIYASSPCWIDGITTTSNSSGGINISAFSGGVISIANAVLNESTKINCAWPSANPYFTYIALEDYLTIGSSQRWYPWGKITKDTSNPPSGSAECAYITPTSTSFFVPLMLDNIPANANIEKTISIQLEKSVDFNGTCSIEIWKNNYPVTTTTSCTLTTSYQLFSVKYTPTQDCILTLVIKVYGTAGGVYAGNISF